MKHIGIVSEFNPFHYGHEYLIRTVKEMYPHQGIISVMSGNFVQRGSFAIQEKYSRAEAALKAGADLVLELPFPFSSLSAEAFGKSAVSILSRTGACSHLAFGTECGEKDGFLNCAKNLLSPEFQTALETIKEKDKSQGFPAAREEAYTALFGKEEILSHTNSSLALEYVMAMEKMGNGMELIPVLRKGEGYHSEKTGETFSSATAIRGAVWKGESLSEMLPSYSLEGILNEKNKGRFPVSEEKLAPVLFYLIRTLSRKELCEYYGFSPLCDRAKKVVGECETIEDLVGKLKSRNITDSRIRRALFSVLCRIPRFAEKDLPAYTLLLGATEKGREILSEMKETSQIPVFTKPAHALKSSDRKVSVQASRAFLAEEIFSMAMPRKAEDGFFLKKTPKIL